uniref:Iron-binding zinc finger CDGSH type domain-containing protein n=1 Tax=mine drainage metagenome TaxID=410659 RepID=E6PXE4_9ZZZZ
MSETHEVMLSSNVGFTAPNGPFITTGELEIETLDGQKLSQPKASFCRCGASAKKPFCDGTHRTSGFVDAGEAVPPAEIAAPAPAAPLAVTMVPNGPLIANGPLTVQNAQKQTLANNTTTAICRCGASANKPYCDGSHNAAGFQG